MSTQRENDDERRAASSTGNRGTPENTRNSEIPVPGRDSGRDGSDQKAPPVEGPENLKAIHRDVLGKVELKPNWLSGSSNSVCRSNMQSSAYE